MYSVFSLDIYIYKGKQRRRSCLNDFKNKVCVLRVFFLKKTFFLALLRRTLG